MKAMIMAAGVGTRLMPLTTGIPKPMIPVANQSLIDNTISLLRVHGFDNIICNLHCHADLIHSHIGSGESFGVNVRYSREEELMGTAGGVKKCESFLDNTFVVMSGDVLTDIDLGLVFQEHKNRGALATIVLKEVDEVEHYGVVLTDGEGRILRFQEKPKTREAISKLANTGIYIFEPEIFSYIPSGKFYDFGRQVFPHLVKSGAPFYGVAVNDYWCDIGNLKAYLQANKDVMTDRVRVKKSGEIIVWENGARVLVGNCVSIGANVRFSGNVVLGDGCSLEDHVMVNNSVIWNNTKVSKGSVMNETIIGSECQIGARSRIGAGAVLASGCVLEECSEVAPGTKVFDIADGQPANMG